MTCRGDPLIILSPNTFREDAIGVRVCLLGSGSGGNCTYVGDESFGLLIDAGLSAQETVHRLNRIGVDPNTLQAVLITHEHRDHIYGLDSIASHFGVTVHLNERTERAARLTGRLAEVNHFETGRPFEINGIGVHPVPLSHDAEDPVAFALHIEGKKMACVTDLGRVTEPVQQALSECHLLILEFNHDPTLLQNGPYPAALKRRVSSGHGHLSNQEAADLLSDVMHPGLRHLFLAHISQTNNLPELALLAAREALQPSRQWDASPTVHLSWQHFVTPPVAL